MIREAVRRNRTALGLARRIRRSFRHARARVFRARLGRMDDLKLHLGCGQEKLPGYVNIDGDPDANADLFLDFRRLGRVIRPGVVSEIRSIHSLSYLNLWQARDLFRVFHRLMKAGGRLIIELPDLEKCARKLLEAGASGRFSPEYLEGVRGLYAFGHDHMAARRDYHPYAFGWSGWHLKQELEEAGFADVAILAPQTHGHPWRDLRIEAVRR